MAKGPVAKATIAAMLENASPDTMAVIQAEIAAWNEAQAAAAEAAKAAAKTPAERKAEAAEKVKAEKAAAKLTKDAETAAKKLARDAAKVTDAEVERTLNIAIRAEGEAAAAGVNDIGVLINTYVQAETVARGMANAVAAACNRIFATTFGMIDDYKGLHWTNCNASHVKRSNLHAKMWQEIEEVRVQVQKAALATGKYHSKNCDVPWNRVKKSARFMAGMTEGARGTKTVKELGVEIVETVSKLYKRCQKEQAEGAPTDAETTAIHHLHKALDALGYKPKVRD